MLCAGAHLSPPELLWSAGTGGAASDGGGATLPQEKQPRFPLQLHHLGTAGACELIFAH